MWKKNQSSWGRSSKTATKCNKYTDTGPSSDEQKQIRSWYNSYKIDSKEANKKNNKTQDNKDKNPEWILSEKSKMSEDI